MYLIALKMLFGDRAKYIAMIVGLTFAALIMNQQPAIFVGLMTRTYNFIADLNAPDLWVMDPSVQFVEENKPMRDTDLWRVRGIEGVAWAVPLFKSLLLARLPDGQQRTVDVTGLDDATLIGAPAEMVEGSFSDLRLSDTIIVDKTAADKRLAINLPDGTSRSLRVGDVLELNDRRALVIGISNNRPTFVTQPMIFTTYSRAQQYQPATRRTLTYILVKVKDGYDKAAVAASIKNSTRLSALTQPEFENLTLTYWMTNTGIPINFGISVLLGFLVGAAVAGQTFYSFTRDNIKQFAVLKAMGVKNRVLLGMILLQALVVGLVGYGLGAGATALFGHLMKGGPLAFYFHPEILLFSAAGIFIIVLLAALLASRTVLKLEPAVVFK